LEEALIDIHNLDIKYDHGRIHALLAKAYDKSSMEALEQIRKNITGNECHVGLYRVATILDGPRASEWKRKCDRK